MYRSILLNMSFVRWLLAVFFYGIGFQGIIVYFPEYLINHKGYSPLQAASLASFIGIGSLVARPLVGFAATETKIGETLMFVGMNFVSFFIYMVAEEVVSYTFIAYIISIAIGAYTSASQTVMFPVTVSVVGHVKGPSGYGIVLGVFGLSCLFAPPLLAYMFQKFGYTTMFKLSGFLFLGAATLTITTLCGREIETEEVNGVFGNQIGDKIDTNYYELEFHALETELELTTNGVKSLLNTHEHI